MLIYPPGPDLSADFPKMEPVPDIPLPLFFDDTCKVCKRPMERVPSFVRTRRKPFAAFQCQNEKCKTQLLLFEAEPSAAFVWSDEFRQSYGFFSVRVDEHIEERDRKLQVRAARYAEAAEQASPPDP